MGGGFLRSFGVRGQDRVRRCGIIEFKSGNGSPPSKFKGWIWLDLVGFGWITPLPPGQGTRPTGWAMFDL
jgi:hypothetical protein